MSEEGTTKGGVTGQIRRLLQDADDDTQQVVSLALEIEKARLHQSKRKKADMANEILEKVKRVIK